MKPIIEICCGSYEDCIAASEGGATRVELNSALHLGGLTPSLASLTLTKQKTPLKVITMVRPRGAGFCYSECDIAIMFEDAKLLLENGADGIAFGFLTEDAQIQVEHTKAMVELIHSYHKEAVFHRAFDCVKDAYKAIEQLIDLHVDRILTSGLQPKAMMGISLIKELQNTYGDKIELLAGSGMNASNAKKMMNETGISQVHSSCKEWRLDTTTSNGIVSYEYASDEQALMYDIVSKELVKKLVESIQ